MCTFWSRRSAEAPRRVAPATPARPRRAAGRPPPAGDPTHPIPARRPPPAAPAGRAVCSARLPQAARRTRKALPPVPETTAGRATPPATGARWQVRRPRAARHIGQPQPAASHVIGRFHDVIPALGIDERRAVVVFKPPQVRAVPRCGFQPSIPGPCNRPARLGVGRVLSQRTDVALIHTRPTRKITHDQRAELRHVVIVFDHSKQRHGSAPYPNRA